MSIFEKVNEYLKEQGLQPKTEEGKFIIFKYQTCTFFYDYPDDDEYYFRLVLPHIYKVNEDNREAVLEIANKLNSSYKLAKVCVHEEYVDISVEIFLDSDPVFDDMIPRVLNILLQAREEFHTEITV